MIQLHLSSWVEDLCFNAPQSISVAPWIFIILSYVKESAWEYFQKGVDDAYGLAPFSRWRKFSLLMCSDRKRQD